MMKCLLGNQQAFSVLILIFFVGKLGSIRVIFVINGILAGYCWVVSGIGDRSLTRQGPTNHPPMTRQHRLTLE